jgi:seryl-tRNA synthetase
MKKIKNKKNDSGFDSGEDNDLIIAKSKPKKHEDSSKGGILTGYLSSLRDKLTSGDSMQTKFSQLAQMVEQTGIQELTSSTYKAAEDYLKSYEQATKSLEQEALKDDMNKLIVEMQKTNDESLYSPSCFYSSSF